MEEQSQRAGMDVDGWMGRVPGCPMVAGLD